MNTAKKLPPPDQVQQLFDETFNKHIRQLTGSPCWIGTQPLNVVNIACLVTLAEREAEIETVPDDPPERFTFDSLVDELNEIIPDFDEDLNSTIQTFIDDQCAKLVKEDEEEEEEKEEKEEEEKEEEEEEEEVKVLVAAGPILKISKLLNAVFPQMPGMSLVAYIIQTMGEVISGRKDLNAGHSQFDQILEMHGKTITNKSAKKKGVTNFPAPEKLDPAALAKAQEKQEKKRLQAKKLLHSYAKRQQKTLSTLTQSTSVIKSFDDRQTSDTSETENIQKISSPNETDTLEDLKTQETQEPQDTKPAETIEITNDPGQKPDITSGQEESPENSGPEGLNDGNTGEGITSPIQEPDNQETIPESDNFPTEPEINLSDDLVESKIAAFEEKLSMSCPTCHVGNVQHNFTSKGKSFYICSDTTCDFISWGKPYHMVCPSCENPFLIEVTDREGTELLKCPRITCRYKRRLDEPEKDIPVKSKTVRRVKRKASSSKSKGPKKKVRKVVVRKKK